MADKDTLQREQEMGEWIMHLEWLVGHSIIDEGVDHVLIDIIKYLRQVYKEI